MIDQYLSQRDVATDKTGGYVHVIIPDNASPTGFKSKRASVEMITPHELQNDISQIPEPFLITENNGIGFQKTFTLQNDISNYGIVHVVHNGCEMDYLTEFIYEISAKQVIVTFPFETKAGDNVLVVYWTGTQKIPYVDPYTIQNQIATVSTNTGVATVDFDIVSTITESISYSINAISNGIIVDTIIIGSLSLSIGTNSQSKQFQNLPNGDYTFKINIGTYSEITNQVTVLRAAIFAYSDMTCTENGDSVLCELFVTNNGGVSGSTTISFQKDTDTIINASQKTQNIGINETKLFSYTFTAVAVGSHNFKVYDESLTLLDTVTKTVINTIPTKVIINSWEVGGGDLSFWYPNGMSTYRIYETPYKQRVFLNFAIPISIIVANITSCKLRIYFNGAYLVSNTLELWKTIIDAPLTDTGAYYAFIFYSSSAIDYFSVSSQGLNYFEITLDLTKVKANMTAGQQFNFVLKVPNSETGYFNIFAIKDAYIEIL